MPADPSGILAQVVVYRDGVGTTVHGSSASILDATGVVTGNGMASSPAGGDSIEEQLAALRERTQAAGSQASSARIVDAMGVGTTRAGIMARADTQPADTDDGAAVQTAADERLPAERTRDAAHASAASVVDATGAALGDAAAITGQLPPHRYLFTDGDHQYFRVLPLEQMRRDVIEGVLNSRTAYKKALFASAIAQLRENPALPDLPSCTAGQLALSDACLITDRTREGEVRPDTTVAKVTQAAVPQINRKMALVIGMNQYDDKRIPQLVNAMPDAQAVGQTLADALSYDVVRLDNPSKAQLIETLNMLASRAREQDSLVVYFAGHGELVEGTGYGYWIARDSRADDPRTWISNADVNRVLGAASSRQIAVVADSCYSGAFAKEASLADQRARRQLDSYLSRRAVTIMSSGGDEPVADSGKYGHSVFAWNFMEQLRQLGDWAPGASLFGEIRTAVERELPQTPMYGASLTAGHQEGGDYLFERRRVER